MATTWPTTIAAMLVSLFVARFDPATAAPAGAEDARARKWLADIETALDQVPNLDEDRILRLFLNVINATVRTSYFHRGADGQPRPYVSFKFNPALVQEYRLIGYETRALRREDFGNDRVDAGDIGAGHQVTALYEIAPVGSSAALTRPSRYQQGQQATGGQHDELGHVALRYKVPGESQSRLIETPISQGVTTADSEASFAAAIAGVGQLLGDDRYLGDWGWDDAIALAEGNRGEDRFGYRAEAVRLMRLARDLSER